MAPFRSVNTPSASEPAVDEVPRAPPAPVQPNDAPSPQPPNPAADEATTPTRANFQGSALPSQQSLPKSPFRELLPASEPAEAKTPRRDNSQRSKRSRDSEDLDMDDSDGVNTVSSNESVNADGTGSSKKKKTQRFYCTNFPPCHLSFTRSEHLARHIRKHTGERPFVCHCNRRFSRLDNLRQHAQTVHQNEEIPMDSLAATGTRFQRQIRNDRARQAPGRSRAATAGSIVPNVRGHVKSFSTSNVGSTVPNFGPGEGRRRPPAIVMPSELRSQNPLETIRGISDNQMHGASSPGGYNTPTSSNFSTGPNSPLGPSWGFSPGSSHSRSRSMYSIGDRTPNRRLSVPSGSNPFQLTSPTRQFATDRNSSYSPYSGTSSILSSPTTPTSEWSRRESISNVADDPYRRRTWHPDTRDFNGASRLSQVINLSQLGPSPVPPPLANPDQQQQQQQQQQQRLPGIESFDYIPQRASQRPSTPPKRIPSPMMVDSDPATAWSGPDRVTEGRQPLSGPYDTSLHRGITRLNIDTPPRDSATAWANEANQAVLAQAEQVRTSHAPPTVRFGPRIDNGQRGIVPATMGSRHQHTVSAPIANPSRENRRGWYHGPIAGHAAPETIHEGRAHVDRIVHPNINEFQGFPARDNPPVVHQQSSGPPAAENRRPQSGRDDLRALDALVAVATNEASTTNGYERSQDRGQSGGWGPFPIFEGRLQRN